MFLHFVIRTLVFLSVWFICTIFLIAVLSSYENQRPNQIRAEDDEDERKRFEKEIGRATGKVAATAGLLMALAWMAFRYSN